MYFKKFFLLIRYYKCVFIPELSPHHLVVSGVRAWLNLLKVPKDCNQVWPGTGVDWGQLGNGPRQLTWSVAAFSPKKPLMNGERAKIMFTVH